MIKPRPDLDPFDSGFDADDEFATSSAEPGWAPIEPTPASDPYAAFPSENQGFDSYQDETFQPSSAPLTAAMAEPALHRQAPDAAAFPSSTPATSATPSQASRPNPVGEMQASLETSFNTASVPRIAIHVFCERPQTAQAAQQALKDRRLSRASTEVLPGGLSAAVAHYGNTATPPLVVVESSDSGDVLLSQLDQLAEVCDPGTKVVVIGSANDITLYRQLMSRGVSEYLVAPLRPVQLINAITTLYADPAAPFIGRSIAVVGAKGGSGASTIAHNIAYAFSERLTANTVLVDYDLPFGTAGLDFNQDPLQGVANALNQPDRLDPVLLERMMAKCSDRLSLFAAPATLDDDYEIGAEAFEEVANKIRTTAPFVVMDLPHLWSPWMRKMLLTADEVILVATPDLASLRNAKNLIDLIKSARPNDAPPRLVLNQVGLPGRPEIPVGDFGDAVGLIPSLCLPFDGKLFGQAANNGQMLEEVNAKSKVVEGLNQLAQMISRREIAQPQKKSLLASLLKK